jgi:hypothetical protein
MLTFTDGWLSFWRIFTTETTLSASVGFLVGMNVFVIGTNLVMGFLCDFLWNAVTK